MESEVPSVLQKLQKWGDYPGYGDVVEPTRFVPCKTPLSCEIIDSWNLPEEPKHCLTLPILLSQQALKGRQIGLVLDLSNHETLYAADLPSAALQYVHIRLVAKEFPQQDAIDQVIQTAQDFWSKHPNEHIAIHCAYGYNRTGFVVCAYLVLACGLTVDEALHSFGRARSPGVRHEKFVEELHRRYDLPKGAEAAAPSRSSMSSLRSDMACVADFLDNGPGMDGLNTRQSSPQRAHPRYTADDSHSVASSDFYPGGMAGSWGRDSLLGAASVRAPESVNSLELPQETGRDEQGGAGAALLPPLARGGSNASPAIPVPQPKRSAGVCRSLGSQSSINNDSLGLDQRHIFEHFFDEAAHGAAAARAENKGRRRSGSDGSRRWHRNMLPCISGEREPAVDPVPPEDSTNSTFTNVQQASDSHIMHSPAKPVPMSSPFANVQADARQGLQRSGSGTAQQSSVEHLQQHICGAPCTTKDVCKGGSSVDDVSGRQSTSRCSFM